MTELSAFFPPPSQFDAHIGSCCILANLPVVEIHTAVSALYVLILRLKWGMRVPANVLE